MRGSQFAQTGGFGGVAGGVCVYAGEGEQEFVSDCGWEVSNKITMVKDSYWWNRLTKRRLPVPHFMKILDALVDNPEIIVGGTRLSPGKSDYRRSGFWDYFDLYGKRVYQDLQAARLR